MTEVTFEFRMTVTMQIEDQNDVSEMSTRIVDAVDQSVKSLNPGNTSVRNYLDDITVKPEIVYTPWLEFDFSLLTENESAFFEHLMVEGDVETGQVWISFGYDNNDPNLRVRVEANQLDDFRRRIRLISPESPAWQEISNMLSKSKREIKVARQALL